MIDRPITHDSVDFFLIFCGVQVVESKNQRNIESGSDFKILWITLELWNPRLARML